MTRSVRRGPREAIGRFRQKCKNGVLIVRYRIRCAMGKEVRVRPRIQRRLLALGSGDGRWVICPDRLTAKSVVYSFGIGTNVTFDVDLIREIGCEVHAFDPTPLSVEWLRSQTLPPSFFSHPWGLAAYDGSAHFTLPKSHSVSFTMSDGIPSKSVAECPVYRLRTVLNLLGHERINLLKIDIEGAEYQILDDLITESDRIDQLLIEFHHRWLGSASKTDIAIKRLEDSGLRLFYASARGLEYGFIR